MSDFRADVVRVRSVEPIEGADRIELAVVGEYRSVVQKGAFEPGDLAVYLPEQSVLPEWLIERLNLTGKLAGAKKNRIKAVKLRGCLSQGVLLAPDEYDVDEGLQPYSVSLSAGVYSIVAREGQDVAAFLGVTKFDPMEAMDESSRRKLHGECAYIPGKTVKYDFENWKKHPGIFAEGDEVVITEKLHGTMCCFAYYPGLDHEDLPDDVFVYSKGLGSRGQVFKWNEANAGNLYLKAFHALTTAFDYVERCEASNDDIHRIARSDIIERAVNVLDRTGIADSTFPIYIFGEVFGKGVQDLAYGHDDPAFRAFDIWVGTPEQGRFLDAVEKYGVFEAMGLDHVPILYRGPFDRALMLSLTDGKTALGGANIREGVVITSAREENVHRFGRKILKNVSGDYLTRKGETTEFQ